MALCQEQRGPRGWQGTWGAGFPRELHESAPQINARRVYSPDPASPAPMIAVEVSDAVERRPLKVRQVGRRKRQADREFATKCCSSTRRISFLFEECRGHGPCSIGWRHWRVHALPKKMISVLALSL